jgi:hypothetical protein
MTQVEGLVRELTAIFAEIRQMLIDSTQEMGIDRNMRWSALLSSPR